MDKVQKATIEGIVLIINLITLIDGFQKGGKENSKYPKEMSTEMKTIGVFLVKRQTYTFCLPRSTFCFIVRFKRTSKPTHKNKQTKSSTKSKRGTWSLNYLYRIVVRWGKRDAKRTTRNAPRVP